MTRFRPAGIRLTAALAALLAVTGAGFSTPAGATTVPPAAVAASGAEQTVLPVPAGSALVSTGPTGMLISSLSDSLPAVPVYRWVRFADGATTVLPGTIHWGSQGTDLVASRNGAVFTLTDMSGATDPVVIDTSAFNTATTPYALLRVVGSTLLMRTRGDNGRFVYHLVSSEGGQVVNRRIALPDDAIPWEHYSNGPGELAVRYGRPGAPVTVGVVDVATGAVTPYQAVDPATSPWPVDQSAEHVAWLTADASQRLKSLDFVDRGTGRSASLPLGVTGNVYGTYVSLTGGWAVYGSPGGGSASYPDALHPVTARSLATGETVRLLDHGGQGHRDADGGLLVLGGTVEHGEGLYRIAVDPASGKPAATLVASSGRPTVLTVLNETPLPSGTVDFDRTRGTLKASWTLSRNNASVRLVLTHTATGKTRTWTAGPTQLTEARGVFAVDWDGRLEDGEVAYNGAYTWSLSAKPLNGIGPDVVRSGTFTATRTPKPHDFDDNGSPDVIFGPTSGAMTSYDLGQIDAYNSGRLTPTTIGVGWGTYDRITATGNIAGTPVGDLVARDRSGVLWLYKGNGQGGFGSRARIGAGWQIYDKITAGSDLNGDGRPDLLATDKAGDLWLYKGTGNAAAPYAPRVKAGFGWGVYNSLTATGNLAGGPAGDLVARDTAGVLWLYLGKGDGTFAPRTRIGAGWGRFDALAGVGDTDRDGRNDLVAYDKDADHHRSVSVYRGTGDWRAPFKPADTPSFNRPYGAPAVY